MARQAVFLAGRQFKLGNIETGLLNLEIAKHYEVWAFSEAKTDYGLELFSRLDANQNLSASESASLDKILALTSQLDQDYLGPNQYFLAKVVGERLDHLLNYGQCGQSSCSDLVKYGLKFSQSANWFQRDLVRLKIYFPNQPQLNSIN
jgi:hypothetical protein